MFTVFKEIVYRIVWSFKIAERQDSQARVALSVASGWAASSGGVRASSTSGAAWGIRNTEGAHAGHFSKIHFRKMHFSNILQIFGGLVLGCIKTKFCKKICVWQHFSSSTRFASICTAAISKFSQKNRFEKTAIFVKFQQKKLKNCKCRKIFFRAQAVEEALRKICKILSNFKNFSLRIW